MKLIWMVKCILTSPGSLDCILKLHLPSQTDLYLFLDLGSSTVFNGLQWIFIANHLHTLFMQPYLNSFMLLKELEQNSLWQTLSSWHPLLNSEWKLTALSINLAFINKSKKVKKLSWNFSKKNRCLIIWGFLNQNVGIFCKSKCEK